MADDKRKKDPEFATPKGTFVWPKLSEPDYGTSKFPVPEGQYKVKLRLKKNDPAVQAFIEKLKPFHAEAMALGQEAFDKLPVAARKKLGSITEHPLFTPVYDKETEEETDEIEFSFKMKASGTYKKGPKQGQKWTRKPIIVDAKGNRISNPPAIWGGTVGRISFSARPMFVAGTGIAGLSYSLIGVKIIDLVSTGGGRSAESMGLGGDEGDYEYEEDVMASDESKPAAPAAAAGGEQEDF